MSFGVVVVCLLSAASLCAFCGYICGLCVGVERGKMLASPRPRSERDAQQEQDFAKLGVKRFD